MPSEGSVSRWIVGLKVGDAEAAQRLWERYYRRLVGLARKRLRAARRREADEEDVAQNAFHSFFRGVGRGRFPRLDDRDDLWRLLVLITVRKSLDQLKHERSKRQGGGTPAAGPSISPVGGGPRDADVEQVVGDEPTPEFAALIADECDRLLDQLGDAGLRRVAVWKMEGYSNEEIAGMLGSSLRTVARKLEVIRTVWSKEPTP
jgi:DNA-directed RNA polymerase specialized sigma24 family protein